MQIVPFHRTSAATGDALTRLPIETILQQLALLAPADVYALKLLAVECLRRALDGS